MNKLIIILIIINLSVNCFAQSSIQRDTGCGFFKKNEFKNGVDTLIIKASLRDINPLTTYGYLDELNKDIGINKKKFTYQVVFVPENCSIEYIAPSSANNIDKIFKRYPGNFQIPVYLTCVVFNKYTYDNNGTPYFVIIKIVDDKP